MQQNNAGRLCIHISPVTTARFINRVDNPRWNFVLSFEVQYLSYIYYLIFVLDRPSAVLLNIDTFRQLAVGLRIFFNQVDGVPGRSNTNIR